jgi:hypothetical protein
MAQAPSSRTNDEEIAMKGKLVGRFLVALAALVLPFLLGGCTPDKAKALNLAAIQFRNEALAAIDALAAMRQQELAAPPRSAAEATAQFVKDVTQSDTRLTYDEALDALDPFAPRIADRNRKDWNAFLTSLRTEYQEFSAIFQNLERGSFLAADPVKKSERHAENLVAQLAAFAVILDEAPPQLLQYRSAYLVDLEAARKLAPSPDRDRRIAELRERLVQLQEKERELQRATVAQCLKAATLGYEMRQLIIDYDKLSLDDINVIIGKALIAAGELTGNDYAALRTKAGTLIQRIEGDGVWRTVVDRRILQRVNEVVAGRQASQ